MAEEPNKEAQHHRAGERLEDQRTIGLGIRLVPSGDSDQPVVANYSALNVARGMVFIDFGFLEPAMLAALPRMAKQGRKLPDTVRGRLAVRVAMGYDALANLHQQLGRVLAGLSDSERLRSGEDKGTQ